MAKQRVIVSHLEPFCVGAFRVGLCAWPLVAAAATRQRAVTAWIIAAAAAAAGHLLFRYAERRCSSERLAYRDGLLVIAASMRTGWISASAALAFPALLVAFVTSLGWACSGDLRGVPDEAPQRFERLVSGFYRLRMHD